MTKQKKEFFKHYGFFVAYRGKEWLEVHDLITLRSFASKRAAVRAYEALTEDIKKEGLSGWLTWVESTNRASIRLMLKLGAIPYRSTRNKIFFVREVD